MSNVDVFPELVTGRDDGFRSESWRIERGSSWRGDASCDLSHRVLRVPWERDERARVVRAHELIHVRVSPHQHEWVDQVSEIPARALECAEEMRVNTILLRLGFDGAQLRDGSERLGGERLARSGNWPEAACFLLAVLGTGAERELMAGIRRGDPTWVAPLRAVASRAKSLVRDAGADELGATVARVDGVPRGYGEYTIPLARLVTSVSDARLPTDAESLRRFKRSLRPGARRPPSGHFADLHFAQSSLAVRARTGGVRHRRAAVSGVVLAYPGRLLTDEQRRAFAASSRRHGGVVVIDQSGSMDLDRETLTALAHRAPDSLVVGYSHRPGDRGATPNAWVLADRGGVVSGVPSGNVGNGVDGPVLRWAIAHRRTGEPIVWVSDGQVTDSADHPDVDLARECARLVRSHHIVMVRTLDEVANALRTCRRRRPWGDFGRVGRAIREIGDESGRLTSW